MVTCEKTLDFSEMFFVYILYSDHLLQFYTGYTVDLEKRIESHNKGLNQSTKKGKPWKIVELFVVETRREALILERGIKKRGAKRFLNDLQIPFGV